MVLNQIEMEKVISRSYSISLVDLWGMSDSEFKSLCNEKGYSYNNSNSKWEFID